MSAPSPAGGAAGTPVGERDEDLLVVIDLQRTFADPHSEWFAPRFEEILRPVDRLIAAFSPRVVFTRFVAPAVPEGAWREYYRRWSFALVAPDDPMYELVDRYAGYAATSLVTTTFGKWGPALAERLGAAGGGLVLCGVSTDCCVLATALAAADAGVHVEVVAEACAGIDDVSHRRALDAMTLFAPVIEVVSIDEVAP